MKKIYRSIDKFNSIVSFKIISRYNKGRDAGYSSVYGLRGNFYALYLIRILLVLVRVLTLKKDTFATFKNILISKYSPNLRSRKSNSISVKIKEFLFTLFGFRYWVPSTLLPLLPDHEILKQRLNFVSVPDPLISIMIPARGRLDLLYNCLLSIKDNTTRIAYEIVLIDDFSSDVISSFISKNVSGVKLYQNSGSNVFFNAVSEGLLQSNVQYICLLSSACCVSSGWLDAQLEAISGENVSGVGSKILSSDGLLVEAGGIVYKDASIMNYGRNDRHGRPRYNYLKEVDFCSGILMLKKEDYKQCVWDEKHFSSDYGIIDICFQIRHHLKKKIIYQPLSEVIYHKEASVALSNKDREQNRNDFVKKWTKELNNYHNKGEVINASRRLIPSQSILFIDSTLPFHDKDSGSKRASALIKILSSNYHVVFLPADGKKVEPYFTELAGQGIEVLYRFPNLKKMMDELENILPLIDYMWVSRPDLNQRFKGIKERFPRIKWIYDTLDLHYLRFQRALEFDKEDKALSAKVDYYKGLELKLAKSADITIAITRDEEIELKKNGVESISVVPNIHRLEPVQGNAFEDRDGLLFIGSYEHQPNVDAVVWLVEEIMPIVWAQMPEIKVTLLGSNPKDKVLSLVSEKVIVPGYIHDVSPYFISSRIFVAPLRYGAGMKGKIGQALEYKLPIITTDIGAEGMSLVDGRHVLIASETYTFAQSIINLYKDKLLWTKLSESSYEPLMEFTPEVVGETIKKEILI